MSEDPLAMIGQTLGHYRIERELGRGGMGAVFLAHDEVLERDVVIKVMRPDMAQSERARQRFLREAKAALAFSHPNAIATRSCEASPEGLLFIVQDYSPGRSLDAILEDGPLDLPRALDLTRQVLRALREAHGEGILHRDLKPANLMIEVDRQGREHLRVCDFGLAKLLDSEEVNLTGAHVLGTPTYMAPEQASGEPADERVDLYQVGVILYELLSGRPPFRGSTQEVLLKKMMADAPALTRRLPPKLRELVSKSVARDPSARFASALDFIEAIDDLGIELGGHGNESARRHRKVSDLSVAVPALPPERASLDPPRAVEPHLTTDWLEHVTRALSGCALGLSALRVVQLLAAGH